MPLIRRRTVRLFRVVDGRGADRPGAGIEPRRGKHPASGVAKPDDTFEAREEEAGQLEPEGCGGH
eukprot:256736-Prorocentrum_minimum.AAC.2